MEVITPDKKIKKRTGVVDPEFWPQYGAPEGTIKPDPKQIYGTPQWFMDWVNEKFGARELDVCALHHNRKAPYYIGPAGYVPENPEGWIGADALSTDWIIPGNLSPARCFCNPEYCDIEPWIEQAARQVAAHRVHVLMLTPLASPGWFGLGHRQCYAIHTFDKRIDFDPAPGVTITDSNPKDSMLWEFRHDATGAPRWYHHSVPKPKKLRIPGKLRDGQPVETTAA